MVTYTSHPGPREVEDEEFKTNLRYTANAGQASMATRDCLKVTYVCDTALRVKTPAVKPGHPGSLPGTNIMGGRTEAHKLSVVRHQHTLINTH